MLLPNWGIARELAWRPRRKRWSACAPPPTRARRGPIRSCWPTLPACAARACALHRNLQRHAVYGDLRLVWPVRRRGNPVPDELHDAASRCSAARCDLHAAPAFAPPSRPRACASRPQRDDCSRCGTTRGDGPDRRRHRPRTPCAPRRRTSGAAGRGQPGQPDGRRSAC